MGITRHTRWSITLLATLNLCACVNYDPTGQVQRSQVPPDVRAPSAPSDATAHKRVSPADTNARRRACRLAVQSRAEVRSFEDPVFAEPAQLRSLRERAWRARAYRECMSR